MPTIEEYKAFCADIDPTPGLKADFQNLAIALSEALNTSVIKPLAFGLSQLLWEKIAGSPYYGKILKQIVLAHQATLDGQIKLKTWIGDRYYYWQSAKQFEANLGVSIPTVRKCIKKLESLGLIEYRVMKNDFGIACYHIALRFDNFFAQLKRFGLDIQNIASNQYRISPPSIYTENKKKKLDLEGSGHEKPDQRFACPQENQSKAKASGDREEERLKSDCLSNSKTSTTNSNLGEEEKSRGVDFLVNNQLLSHYVQTTLEVVTEGFEKAIAFCTPILRKDMEHEPRFDKYFNGGNQQAEIRDRAKNFSALGHSAFTSIEQMQECQMALTKYYSRTLDPNQAVKEAYWTIKGEQEGKRSLFVADFLEGKMIGTWCKREWEVEPGTPAPVLLAYLRCMLRREGDSHAQTINRVSWQLKDSQAMIKHWAECKRLIAIEKPRLENAMKLGQNLIALKIPEWIIESFRPETSVESVTDTAIALGEIASEYSKVCSSESVVQSSLKLQTTNYKLQTSEEEEIPITIPGGVTLDFVKQIADGRGLGGSPHERPVQEAGNREPQPLSPEHEVDQLLSDPATRLEGAKLARQRNIPVVKNCDGVPIAVDFNTLDESRQRDAVDAVMDGVVGDTQPSEPKPAYAAHKLFVADELPPIAADFRDVISRVRESLKNARKK